MAEDDKSEKQKTSGDEPSAEGSSEDGSSEPKKKKIPLTMILLPVLFVVGLGAGFLVQSLMGGSDKPEQSSEEQTSHADSSTSTQDGHGEGEKAEGEEKPVEGFYMALDPITVNLRSQGKQQRYLKLSVRLELNQSKDEKTITTHMPKIKDQFQMFLRELRVEDLEGSSGIFKVKEELLSRVNHISPATVKDILFDEFLVQ